MDLLISLIVWLLKQLFGESEKPADVGGPPRSEGTQRPRPVVKSGGGAPSLEELLAEVRREAEEKRRQQSGEVPPPPPPRPQSHPQQPRQQSRPQPVVRAEPPQRKSIEDSDLPARSVLETRELKSSLEVSPEAGPQNERIAPLPIAVRNEAVATVNVIQESRRARKAAERKGVLQQALPEKVPAGAAVAAMLSTIRKGSGEQRREIAQQAFVLNEIFGPCRSHRGYRPPPRV